MSDLESEQEHEIEGGLQVSTDAPTAIDFVVDLGGWFRLEGGTLINPGQVEELGLEEVVEENIEDSIDLEDEND